MTPMTFAMTPKNFNKLIAYIYIYVLELVIWSIIGIGIGKYRPFLVVSVSADILILVM